MSRRISDLRWAELSSNGPWKKSPKKFTRTQKQGLVFEATFIELIKAQAKERLGEEAQVFANQWIRFEDAGGEGFAQPDVFVQTPKEIIIFECKRTWTLKAWVQLYDLYMPLVHRAVGLRPTKCIQVCKNLAVGVPAAKVVLGLDWERLGDGYTVFMG